MRNKISKLHTDSGDTLEEHQEITNELTRHFSKLLTKPNHERQEDICRVTQRIPSLVNNEHNRSLMQPISMQEVKAAVEQMVEGTSLGSNGFTIDFFLHCWNLLKDEVLELVEESRKNKWILPALNATHLVLIPKEIGASHPGKFHPISLCNVIYKIISKMVANRMKPLLPLLISPEQSGYVEGR